MNQARRRQAVRSLLAASLHGRGREIRSLAAWSLVQALPALLSGRLVAEALDHGFLAHRSSTGFGWLALLGACMLVGAWGTRQAYQRLAGIVEPFRDELATLAVRGSVLHSVAPGAAPDTTAVARLTQHVEIAREAYASVFMVVQTFLVTGGGALVGLLSLDPAVLILVVPPLVLGLILFVAVLGRAAAHQRASVMADERLAEVTSAAAGGLRDIVACGAEEAVATDAGECIELQAETTRHIARFTAVQTLAVALGGWVPVMLILLGGSWLRRHGATTGVVIGALTYIMQSVEPAMQTVIRGVGRNGLWLLVTLERIVEAAEPPAPVNGGSYEPAGLRSGPDHVGVRLQDVTFRYGAWADPVIDGLDLVIPNGDHLAVVGPSGVGKSTLAGLITGLLKPQGGRVFVGGTEVGGLDSQTLASCRVFIPQQAYVFAGSVWDNLTYLKPEATHHEVDVAVDELGMRALLKRLGGYGAELNPSSLSAGERQLVTLVRAYVSPARIAILDEATCHLDAAAEARVEQAFSRRPGALVVIAHRISSALRARRILAMDGTRTLLGTHDSLLVDFPLYRDLVGYWRSPQGQLVSTSKVFEPSWRLERAEGAAAVSEAGPGALFAASGPSSDAGPPAPATRGPEGGSTPPVPARRPRLLAAHGDERIDDWYWLRDAGDPEVRSHLEAENAYADVWLGRLAPLRAQLFSEIRGRTQEGDVSAPARKGDWWYYDRTVEGLSYMAHCRRHDPDRALTALEVLAAVDEPGEQVILDENRLAGTSSYFALGLYQVSPDQSLVAYATDRTGGERFLLRFRDLATDTDQPDILDGVYYGAAWSADSRSLFYLKPNEAMRPYQVWRHVLGSQPDEDTLVFEETDERFYVQIGLTRSERFIVISSQSNTSSEVRFLDAGEPGASPRLITARRDGVQYVAEDAALPGIGDCWLILSNDNGGENFALYYAPSTDTGHEGWRPFLAHSADVKLEAVETFRDHVVVVQREGGLRHLLVVRLADGACHRIEQPEPVYAVSAPESLEFSTTAIRFTYSSLVTPHSTVEYDLDTRGRVVVKREPVLGGYDAADYETSRVWATAPNGTGVPVSLVHRRGLRRDGGSPCLLYGYGAYDFTLEPSFSPGVVSLLERGFVFAIAHVRGGGELGRHWYLGGKLLEKRNSFLDFIACAEHLIAEGYTSAERLVIRGGSAGGLLVAAAANMRPDLFAGVVAEVPFVDCLTTLLDPGLPLTVTEWEEWGNPLEDPEAYRYIKSYSPYDNLIAASYPAVLATASLNDQRVAFWEPAKWVAKLRDQRVDDRPTLLRTEMGAGHGGVSGRYEGWRDEARIQAFILAAVGIVE